MYCYPVHLFTMTHTRLTEKPGEVNISYEIADILSLIRISMLILSVIAVITYLPRKTLTKQLSSRLSKNPRNETDQW